MKFIRVIGLLAVLAAVLIPAVPVYATDLPDSTPTVEEINIYRNVLETGDRLFLVYFNIPYATLPTDPVWMTYMWTLVKSDNVTEIGTCLPVAYNDDGYGYNLSAMYFSASESGNFTWSGAHTARLRGNPAAFTSPPLYDYPITSADYSALTDSTLVQAEIGDRILTIAAELDTRWGLGSTYSLLNQTETGTVLSIYGEAYFRSVIYGLQGMCPQIFAYVVSDLDLTARTWADTYEVLLLDQWQGTWVDTAKNAADALFGTSFSLFWIIITIAAALTVLILNIVVANDAWLGILDAFVVMIICARLGLYELGFLALISAVAMIYDASRLWGVFK